MQNQQQQSPPVTKEVIEKAKKVDKIKQQAVKDGKNIKK